MAEVTMTASHVVIPLALFEKMAAAYYGGLRPLAQARPTPTPTPAQAPVATQTTESSVFQSPQEIPTSPGSTIGGSFQARGEAARRTPPAST